MALEQSSIEIAIDEYYLQIQKEGQEFPLLSEEETYEHPFPGLRSFKTSESHLFFGREGQGLELLRRLDRNRFVAVIGASGSGKSSLVRAGLIPTLHAGYLKSAGSRWKIAICRPASNPIANLAVALERAGLGERSIARQEDRYAIIQQTLSDSPFGLVEIVEKGLENERFNLLVIIDQFEELFRYNHDRPGSSPSESIALFVTQLVEAARQMFVPIYIMITIRSEFIGECVRFRGLPDLINEGQYLVPRLTRDQIKLAIEGPLAVVDAEIALVLVNRLLNDVGDDMDQLPIFQHALMRTYQFWQKQGGNIPIDHFHYESIGTMSKALDMHANEVLTALDEKQQAIAKLLFQSLTEKTSENRGIRRPLPIEKIYGVCQIVDASYVELEKVVEHFRQPEASFLIPPSSMPIRAETVIDISHESLMRLWHKLAEWVEEEAEDGKRYCLLQSKRKDYESGQEELLIYPQLGLFLEWAFRKHCNEYWASRYHKEESKTFSDFIIFQKNFLYLENSKRAWKNAEVAKEAEEQQRQRKQFTTLGSILLLLLIILLGVSYLAIKINEEKSKAEISAKNESVAKKKAIEATAKANRAIEEANRINDSLTVLSDSLKNTIEDFHRSEKERDSAQEALVYSKRHEHILQISKDSVIDVSGRVQRKIETDSIKHLIRYAKTYLKDSPRKGFYLLTKAYRSADSTQRSMSEFKEIANLLINTYNTSYFIDREDYIYKIALVCSMYPEPYVFVLLKDNTLYRENLLTRETIQIQKFPNQERIDALIPTADKKRLILHVTKGTDCYRYAVNAENGQYRAPNNSFKINRLAPLFTARYRIYMEQIVKSQQMIGKIYDFEEDIQIPLFFSDPNFKAGTLRYMAASPDGEVLLVTYEHKKEYHLAKLNLRNGEITLLPTGSDFQSAEFISNKEFITSTSDGVTRKWNLAGKEIGKFFKSMSIAGIEGNKGWLISNRGKYLTFFSPKEKEREAKVMISKFLLKKLYENVKSWARVSIAEDYLLLYNSEGLFCWDVKNKRLLNLPNLSSTIHFVQFSPDDKALIIFTENAKLYLYIPHNKENVNTLSDFIKSVENSSVFGDSWEITKDERNTLEH